MRRRDIREGQRYAVHHTHGWSPRDGASIGTVIGWTDDAERVVMQFDRRPAQRWGDDDGVRLVKPRHVRMTEADYRDTPEFVRARVWAERVRRERQGGE